MQKSSVEDVMSPATALVKLALKKWAERRVRADNISVIVILFENCISLGSAFKCNCSFKDDGVAVGVHCVSSILDMPVTNPGRRKKQFSKTRHTKKSHTKKRKPLSSINDVRSDKCGLVTSRKKFKIPTTPEQRSAYWSRRRLSQMIENLPLDSDLFANKRSMLTHYMDSEVDSFACKYQSPLSVTAAR